MVMSGYFVKCRWMRLLPIYTVLGLLLMLPISRLLGAALPGPVEISASWQLQAVAQVPQSGEEIARISFEPKGWLAATVPGTVLTSLVDDGIYPEPLYG
jgi:hypothetical protein